MYDGYTNRTKRNRSPYLAHVPVFDVHAEVAERRIPVFVWIAGVNEIRHGIVGGIVAALFCANQSLLTSSPAPGNAV